MSEQTTPEQRQGFLKQHQSGKLYREIAETARVSVMCVRYWCRRLRRGGTPQSTYRRQPTGILQRFPPLVRYVLLRLRLQHPRWGPGPLRFHMRKRPSLCGQRLPSCTTIGYYLHQWKKFRRPPRSQTHTKRPGAPTRVHEEWQIDYKMGISSAGDCLVNLVDIHDPVGAVAIGSFWHPAGRKGHRCQRLTFPEIRYDLRLCFVRWRTLPDRIQTDNEAVFIGKPHSNFPSPFILWLKGLGIEHVGIRPGRPTDNAEVERQHRTINDYVIIGVGQKEPDLQALLDRSLRELNQELPSQASGCHGLPPLQAHPDLLQPRRPFSAEMELALFDLERVNAYLATFTWHRKVGKTGQVNLGGYHHVYTVGRPYAGQGVVVRFDPKDRQMVFYNSKGDEIRRRPSRQLGITDLTGLAPWPNGVGVQQLPLPLELT